MTIDAVGMCHASFAVKPKDGAPLQRALMRVEAELLIEEADNCPRCLATSQGALGGIRTPNLLIRSQML
jgi:hypothetical protein